MDNINKLIFNHLDINLICNKFELLIQQVKGEYIQFNDLRD